MIRVGYACINTELPSPNRTCRLKNATEARIIELGRANLLALSEILRWNAAHGVTLFRISSDTIPFGSHPVNGGTWPDALAPELSAVAGQIRDDDVRVSMHPGQYTVLNAVRESVVDNAVADLDYHARLLDGLGVDRTHKIIIHIGGVYGDKASAIRRFVHTANRLDRAIRDRLIIENDERSFNAEDLFAISGETGLPVVFDRFHHGCYPSLTDRSVRELVETAAATWSPADGRPKVHYSDQRPGRAVGAHAHSLDRAAFGVFYKEIRDLEIDVMLEAKDKEQSVLAAREVIAGLETNGNGGGGS